MSATRKSSVMSHNAGETCSARKNAYPSSLLAFSLLLLFLVCVFVGGYFFCLQLQIHNLRTMMDDEARYLRQDLKKLRADVDRLASASESEAQRLRQDIERLTTNNQTTRTQIHHQLQNLGLEESETTQFKPVAGTMLNFEDFPDMTDKDDDGDNSSPDDEDDGNYIESDNEPGTFLEGSRTRNTSSNDSHPPVVNVQKVISSKPSSVTAPTINDQLLTTDTINRENADTRVETGVTDKVPSIPVLLGIGANTTHRNRSTTIPVLLGIGANTTHRNRSTTIPVLLGIDANTTHRNRSTNLLFSSQVHQGPRISKRNVEISSAADFNVLRNNSARMAGDSKNANESISPFIRENRTVIAPKNAGKRFVGQSIRRSTISDNQTGNIIVPPAPTATSSKKSQNKYKRDQVPVDSGKNALIDAYQYLESSDYRDYLVEPDNSKSDVNFSKVVAADNVETIDTSCTRKDELSVVVAAHFGADNSSYNMTSHPKTYKGNGLLCHPTGEYKDWKPSNWHDGFNMHDHVTLKDGKFRIQRQGLYWVYAQIFYLDDKDTNGYKIIRNSETVLQCITSSYSQNPTLKSNTCFTGGIVFCSAGDTLSIKSYDNNRHLILEPSRSFFGVFKLGESQIPK